MIHTLTLYSICLCHFSVDVPTGLLLLPYQSLGLGVNELNTSDSRLPICHYNLEDQDQNFSKQLS